MADAAEPDFDDPTSSAPPKGEASSLWALPLLALGLGLVACGILIPAADDNRTIADERARLETEYRALQRQVELNNEFLTRLHADPELIERLKRRQQGGNTTDGTVLLETERSGAVREINSGRFALSPFALLAAEPVVAPPLSVPTGGVLAELCRDTRLRLGVLGVGFFCCMVGLLWGGSGNGETRA